MAHLASSHQGPSTAKPRCNHVSAETRPTPPVSHVPFLLVQNLNQKEVSSQAQNLPTSVEVISG